MAQTNVQAFSGNVGVGTDIPSSVFNTYGGSLSDGGDAYTSKVAATFQVGRGGGSQPADQGTGAILELRHESDYRHVTIESVSESTNSGDIGLRFKTTTDTNGPQERMRIDGDGNVGIGTNNPDCALSVTGNRNTSSPGAGIHMGMTGTSLTQYAMFQMNATDRVEIDFSTPDTDADGRIVYDNTNNSMFFRTNGVDNRLFIKSDGNVGIGTAGPNAPLEVHGADLNGQPVGTTGIISRHVSGGDGVLNIFGVMASNNEETLGLQTQIDGRAWQSDIDGGWSYGNDSRYDLCLQPYKGNVGIGTTNPSLALHINGSSTNHNAAPDGGLDSGLILLRNTKTGSTPYSMALGVDQSHGFGYLNAAGNAQVQPICINTRGANVGIGTTNPSAKLHVYGASGDDTMIRLQSGRGEAPILSFAWSGNSAENFDMLDVDGGQRGFLFGRRYTTGTNQNSNAGWHLYGGTGGLGVRIDYNGLVGINQTIPLYTLDVTGTIRCGTNGRMLNSYVSVPYGAWANIPLGGSRGSYLILAAGTSNDQACAIFTACANSNNNAGSISTQQSNNDYNRNSYIDRRYAANLGPQLIISGSQGYTRTCSVTTIMV